MRRVSDKEFDAVTSLTGAERYSYSVKEIVDSETVWSLGDDTGWVLMTNDAGNELVPIWPHKRFASACATEKWAEAEPRPIELADWLNKWTTGMMHDLRRVAVFPTSGNKGVIVNPHKLKEDLEEEVLKYE